MSDKFDLRAPGASALVLLISVFSVIALTREGAPFCCWKAMASALNRPAAAGVSSTRLSYLEPVRSRSLRTGWREVSAERRAAFESLTIERDASEPGEIILARFYVSAGDRARHRSKERILANHKPGGAVTLAADGKRTLHGVRVHYYAGVMMTQKGRPDPRTDAAFRIIQWRTGDHLMSVHFATAPHLSGELDQVDGLVASVMRLME